MPSEQDAAFLHVLREEKTISNFLDAFFGFLCRCTDFYVEAKQDENIGFPPGLAKKLVIDTFCKWKTLHKEVSNLETEISSHKRNTKKVDEVQVPEAVQEVEISSEDTRDKEEIPSSSVPTQASDCYNGAVRDGYTWSQTISDLDIVMKLPKEIQNVKDLNVNISSQRITVRGKRKVTIQENSVESEIGKDNNEKDDDIIFDGELLFQTRKDESIWSFSSGPVLNIHLEKVKEKWWEALLTGESKIELNKIDCSRNLEELGTEEQMKVQELMWNHQQILLGKPTSDQIQMEEVLKRAWHAEGSPFKGSDYDPSILQYD